jgi:hypothetical protein
MSTRVPPLLARLVDDAAVFPPGNAPLPEAVAAHHGHRAAWYADLVGPLLVPASAVASGALSQVLSVDRGSQGDELEVGIVGDAGIGGLAAAVAALPERLRLRQVEVAVAKRGEDPQPGLTRLIEVAAELPAVAGLPVATCYAEIPLAWGLLGALDRVAAARAVGVDIAPKFRTGGLAAELFPTPIELAAVICACRDRGLRFKLTAGLHHAIRYTDPETGLVHHGFLNLLAAVAATDAGADVADVAPVLAGTDPVLLVEPVRAILDRDRPLWIGFGTCSVAEPLDDLVRLGLL